MNRAVYKELLRTFGRRWGIWFGVAMEVIRVLLMRIYVSILMAQSVASLASGDTDQAKTYLLYFLFAYVGGALIGAIGDLVSHWSENHEYNHQMVVYHQKLTNKDMSFYRENQTGYLASVFRQYLDGIILLNRLVRSDVIRTILSLTVPAIILLFIDIRIGLLTVAIIALQIVYVSWSSKKANIYRDRSHEVYRKITGEVSDEITNIVAFKSGGMEAAAHTRMIGLAQEEIRAFWMRRKTTTLLDLPRGIFTGIGVSAVFYTAISNGASSPEAIGVLVLTMTYMFQLIRNVMDLPNLMYQHDDLITKVYPTLEYTNSEHEAVRDPQNPQKLTVRDGEIRVQDVSFRYPADAKKTRFVTVFDGLHMVIKGGEHVGVVGLSGAGKSTLASLLMRFDDVEGGSISVDGYDIRDVRQSELRQHIAYVPQEPLLFHRSVKENIRYFKPDATEKEIIAAAKAAHAHDFITELPDGYDTIVGERGVKLSGGQKQRIVIARAVLKNAPIIIFDEATSALDSESEKIIQQALPDIIGKHTAIVIAHRLSTVAGLDRIIVMHKGAIVEEGTHAQLLKQRGRYASLWQKQTSGDLG